MAPPNGRSTATAAARSTAPRRATAPARPRLRLVRPGARLRPGLIGTVVITLVFSTLFVLAFMQAVLVQGQLKLDRLDRDIADKESLRARAEIDVATAEAPQRIQAAAQANGLVSPPDVVFIERGAVTPIDPPTPSTAATTTAAAAIDAGAGAEGSGQ